MLICTNAQMQQFKFFILKIIIFDKYFIFFMLFANLNGPQSSHSVLWYFIFNIWLIIPWNNSLVRWCILAIVHWCMDVSVVCSLNPDPSACPFVLSYRCNLTFLYLSHKIPGLLQDELAQTTFQHRRNKELRGQQHSWTLPHYLIVPTCIF